MCITIGPMIASLYLSFTQYDLLTPPKWTGLTNFKHWLLEQCPSGTGTTSNGQWTSTRDTEGGTI